MENNKKIQNWVNEHKELLRKYVGKWIVYNEEGLLAAGDTIQEAEEGAKTTGRKILYFVNPLNYSGIRFRAIHFRSISFHEWQPLYPLKLSFKDNHIETMMLIDSGADASLISYSTGLRLGLTVAEGETKQSAKGIGGGVIHYVWRDVQITIESNTITIPIAWILEGSNQEDIIGRQIVFDAFDIEFRQADEEIKFKFRGVPVYS
jgi:hypothetical protein